MGQGVRLLDSEPEEKSAATLAPNEAAWLLIARIVAWARPKQRSRSLIIGEPFSGLLDPNWMTARAAVVKGVHSFVAHVDG